MSSHSQRTSPANAGCQPTKLPRCACGPPAPPIAINFGFNGHHQARRALDFVQYGRSSQATHETRRIGHRRCEHGRVVQRELASVSQVTDQGLGQRTFPRLARALEQDDRRVRHSRGDERSNVAWEHGPILASSWLKINHPVDDFQPFRGGFSAAGGENVDPDHPVRVKEAKVTLKPTNKSLPQKIVIYLEYGPSITYLYKP